MSEKLAQVQKANRKNARQIPPELPRVPIDLSLPEDETCCPCCGEKLSVIGTKESEVLDIVPIIIQILKYNRKQYGCNKCKSKDALKTAPLPKEHVKNSMASSRLLSWLIVNKYDYHFPLYRTSRLFKDYGYSVSDKTINSWIINTGVKFEYLYTKLIDLLVMQKHLFSDDTPVKLLVPGLNKTKISRLWVYTSKSIPIVIYDFTLTRGKEHPHEFLKNFVGYLQTDAYQAYYALYKDDEGNVKVIPVFCMAHCRRKFFNIAEMASKPGLAHEALGFINKLYDIEKQIKKLSDVEKYDVRQEKSVPILKQLKTWLEQNKELALPGTPISDAINYALNNFEELSNYCLDGRLEIDNNRSERKMRGPKLSMNNHLFYGSEKGGTVAAMLLSLIETCKANHISPMTWFEDVIPKLDYYKTSEIEQLFPHNWAKNYKIIHPDKMVA